MVDGECLAAVHLYFYGCLVAVREPETLNLLILPNEVCPVNPKGRLLRGMASNLYNCKVLRIDPYLSLEQIFVVAFRHGLKDESVVLAEVFFSSQREVVIRARDGAVVMFVPR